MSDTFTIGIDGEQLPARKGETVLQVARRGGIHIPTLCADDRLDAAGCCRACLVEIDGQRRLQPSCAWQATPNMNVKSHSPRVQRHRETLLAMYMADHKLGADGLPIHTTQGNELRNWALETPHKKLTPVHSPRKGRVEDLNPYISFDPELCVVCAKCTRYCDEIEAVNAITLTLRGSETTIATHGERGLLDTTCELCGGCIDVCPTGAMHAKQTPRFLQPEEITKVRTTCNYCGVGCQIDLNVHKGKIVQVTAPPVGETVNDGNLCVKGRFAYNFVHHEQRLTTPMIRGADGELHPATWEEAITFAAKGLLRIKDQHGPHALGFVSSSRCTNEENYLVQKLARAAFGTNNVHQCAAT
ncbi:MAG: 2Fe-2S iron-sulfur cluster binding domain-containing protein [Myxococcales bacterium]|nr:2Fe-2S iron-sulfur cluster binding domain-containing protein [Myxococcales bacterium]